MDDGEHDWGWLMRSKRLPGLVVLAALLIACSTTLLGTNRAAVKTTNVFAAKQVTGTAPPDDVRIQSESRLAATDLGASINCNATPNVRISMIYNTFPGVLTSSGSGPFIDAVYSNDLGVTWFKTNNGNGLPSPTGNYTLQWVDPAAVACPDPNRPQRVFIGSLAAKVTSAAFSGGVPAEKGACIYVSDDGGITFALDGCVPGGGPAGLHYDGASFACDDTGRLYAAFLSVDPLKLALGIGGVDVWQRDPGGVYTQLPSPYPAAGKSASGHPRLAATSGGLYLSVATISSGVTNQDFEGRLELAFLPLNGGWTLPANRPASNALVYQCNQPSNAINFRVAPDQALDVGDPSALGSDEVRVMYGADNSLGQSCTNNQGPVGLRTLHCDLTLTSCADEDPSSGSYWGTNPSGQQFDLDPGVQSCTA